MLVFKLVAIVAHKINTLLGNFAKSTMYLYDLYSQTKKEYCSMLVSYRCVKLIICTSA